MQDARGEFQTRKAGAVAHGRERPLAKREVAGSRPARPAPKPFVYYGKPVLARSVKFGKPQEEGS